MSACTTVEAHLLQSRLDSHERLSARCAQQWGRPYVGRAVRALTQALLEVFEPTYATSAGLPAVLPTPRAVYQTALPQSMLESTASLFIVHLAF